MAIQEDPNVRKVGIVMGSDSDLPVIQKATNMLKSLDIPFEVHVYSAHRTPEEARAFAVNARKNGFGALIAAAGMAAHLAGAMAANTHLPVIGLPVSAKALDGMDALLSTVMMPPGMPVATVGIDAARNAGLLAAQILALTDEGLTERLKAFRAAQTRKAIDKDTQLQQKLDSILED